jgi:hypothetical protein
LIAAKAADVLLASDLSTIEGMAMAGVHSVCMVYKRMMRHHDQITDRKGTGISLNIHHNIFESTKYVN